MKAAVVRQMGKRMEIEDISIPNPIGRDVLVRFKETLKKSALQRR